MLKEIFISMRPQQWYKNGVLLIGIIFSGNLFNLDKWEVLLPAILIFCLVSGAIYILNDVHDYEEDRKHPIKKYRPIASGKLKPPYLFLIPTFLLSIGVFFSYRVHIGFFLIILTYIIQNILYTSFLQKEPILEAFIVSFGFVLRAIAGTVVINVEVSYWIILCAFFLSLLLVLNKRKINGSKLYTEELLDTYIGISTSALILSYSLFTILSRSNLVITVPFVIYGSFRYLFISQKEYLSQEKIIFKDKHMIGTIGLWLLISIAILYMS